MSGDLSLLCPPYFLSLQRLRSYWQHLVAESGALPTASALNPNGLAPVLANLFLGERIGRGMVRLLITGDNLAPLSGFDMQGFPLSMLITADARVRLSEGIEHMFTYNTPVELALEAERSILRPGLSARMLLLPLAPQKGEGQLLVGCLAHHGSVGRAPRRFSIREVIFDPPCAVSQRSVTPRRVLSSRVQAAAQDRHALRSADVSHLRLVHSSEISH